MGPSYDHVGLATTDIDRSISFYQDVMGFEFLSRKKLGEDREQATFLIGEGILVLFYGPNNRYVEKARQPRSGVHHLAFSLSSNEYDAVLQRCEAKGVKVMHQAINSGAKGIGLATYFYDPDGNEIEIKKYEDLPEPFSDYTAEGYQL